MKKSKDFYERNNVGRISKIVIVVLIVCVCFLSVGYSAFSNTLTIENILVTVRPNASARITNVSISSVTNGGISNSEQFTADTLFGNISLPNNNSTVTFKVNVTVFLSSEMKLSSISGLDSNLEYTLSGYNLGDTLCDSNNNCNLGATDDMYITIGYKNGVNNSGVISHPINLNFTFEVLNTVARIGNTKYESLQDAFDDVPTNGVETTVHLIKSTDEALEIIAGQNITLSFHGNTISNTVNGNVINNYGTLRMSDGTITSTTQAGAINNNSTGVFIITGGTISVSGKQTIYNDGGTVTISGNPILKSTSNQRASVQNQTGGTMTITGGTIESTRYSALENHGTLTIGVKDGNASSTTPSFKGSIHGINSDKNYNFYDGVVKASSLNPINNEGIITDKETGLSIVHSGENIGGTLYEVARLGTGYTVTFNAQGGSADYSTKLVEANKAIGNIPAATKSGMIFDGWFDDPDNGSEINTSTVITGTTTFYAHWIDPNISVYAMIGSTEYSTLQDAINAVPTNGTEVTIDVLHNITEKVTTKSGQKIKLNIGNNILRNNGTNPIIENYGILTIYNGTISSNTSQGAINNKKNATLYITGGTINATGTRQALYNDGGTAYISGGSLNSVTAERATVHNLNNGKLYITGSTITSTGYCGVYNASGTVEIGTKDGNINTSSPLITGETYGVENASTFKFYDGLLRGKTHAIQGNVADTDGTITNGTSGNYETAYLE